MSITVRISTAAMLVSALAGRRVEANHRRRCSEVSAVVGYEECARFGSGWGLPSWTPSLSLDLGIVAHRFTADRIDERGTVTHFGVPYSYRVIGASDDDRAFTARALALRMTAEFHGWLYVGAEEEFGDLTEAPLLITQSTQATDMRPTMASSGGLYMGLRGLVGIQAGVDRLTFAGEVATGGRMIVFDTRSQLMGDAQTDSVMQLRSVLEGRVRASYWLSPWIAVGTSFGTSLVERGDVAIGMHISAHSRTFGGRR